MRSRSSSTHELLAALEREVALPSRCIPVCSLALVLLCGVELWCRYAERHALALAATLPAWVSGGPLFVLIESGRRGLSMPYAPLVANLFAGARIAEGIVLGLLYLAAARCRDARTVWGWPVAAGVLMTIVSLASTVVQGADLYAYAGYAQLGLPAAYAPPPHAFAGDRAIIAHWWGDPMVPSVYGPLWLLFAQLAGMVTSTLAGQIAFFRLTNVALLAALPWAMRAYGLRREAIVLFVADPAIVQLFVADAHNDLWPVTLTVLAMLLYDRAIIAAVLLAAAATLCKLPFALLAPLVCSESSSRRRAAAFVATTTVIGLGGSWLLGGPAYARALQSAQHAYPPSFPAPLSALLALVPIATVVLAFFRWRHFLLTYAVVFLRNTAIPWYLLWGLPYALPRPSYVVAFGVLFPLFAYALDGTFHLH